MATTYLLTIHMTKSNAVCHVIVIYEEHLTTALFNTLR